MLFYIYQLKFYFYNQLNKVILVSFALKEKKKFNNYVNPIK
jgi:hypothetical protein